MPISLEKFVDVKIYTHPTSKRITDRDTYTILTTESGSDGVYDSMTSKINETSSETDETSEIGGTNNKAYAQMFFQNGGKRIKFVPITKTDDKSIVDTIIDAVKTLDDNLIYFSVIDANGGIDLATAKGVAEKLDEAYSNKKKDAAVKDNPVGIHRKILIAGISDTTGLNEEFKEIHSLAVKYSAVPGAEATIGAYLSKIKVYATNSVHDYCYTSENIDGSDVDDNTYDTLNDKNINFDYKIAGSVRNIGGNLTDGKSLINEFMLIVLQQTVTERLLALLGTKLKGSTAIARIRSTISDELNYYVKNGYLALDKVWTDEDWDIDYNSSTYTIIESNTPLTSGYLVEILPLASISDEDRKDHRCPPIYIVLADSWGIRKVSITGQVI